MRKTIVQAMCALFLCAAPGLWAQNGNGTLTGKVTSAEGTGIPNATVTATNTSTNASQNVLTAADGSFSIMLPPGTYRVDVETAGYKRTSQQDVVLSTTGPTSVNVTLEAGNMNETVEIRGHSPAVQTANGDVSSSYGERTLRELPVIDRNTQEIVGQQSGITPPEPALDPVRDPSRNRFFSTDGQSPVVNEWSNDGLNNTEPFRNTAIRELPVNSIRQMDVETANQELGHGFDGGAFVNQLTGQGTNTLHGDLYEFWSGDVLRARDYFNNYAGAVNPRFVSNQFGGDVGGPIAKDHTFFYGNYEGLYNNGANSQLTTVPTAGVIGGNFSAIPGLTLYNPYSGVSTGFGRTPFTGGRIASNLINPTARAIASYFPTPNLPGFYDNYVANVPYQNHSNKVDGRIDQHFTDRTSAFLRYGYTNSWDQEGSPLGNVIGSTARDRLVAQNAGIDLQHTFSDRLVSDLRFGYNRYDQKLSSAADQTALGSQLGLRNFSNNLIGINIPGMAPIGAAAYLPEHAVDNTGDAVWNWGLHTSHNDFKWGVEARRIRSDGFTDTMWGSLFGPNGTAYFGPGATMLNATTGAAPISQYGEFYNSLAAFLVGAPSQVGVANYATTPTIRQGEYAAWLGDSIRPFRRLTLDLGARYEIFSPLEPRSVGGFALFNPLTNSYNYNGIGGNDNDYNYYQWRNVAPRVGFALRATDKTVIRGGYGVNYFQYPYMYSAFMTPMYGFSSGALGTYQTATLAGGFSPVLTNTATAPTSLSAQQNGTLATNLPAALGARNMPTPYVQTFSLQVQQEFYWGTVLSVGYVGNLDRHLLGIQELNAALPGAGLTGLPYYSFGRTASTLLYTDGLTSNYNSLQASLTKRFTKGISFMASYTWQKALGYTTANNMLLNPANLGGNYGPLDYDRQHVLTISHILELPWGRNSHHIMGALIGGWELNGIFTWATGTPLTVTADPLACACPGTTVFANLNPGATAINQNGINYLNPSAFSSPTGRGVGNLGRGSIFGPGYRNYDMALFKNFHVTDRFNLQLRGEAYNLTNTPRFMSPVTNINSPDFGQTVTTVNGAFGRQVNVAARVIF